jgi:hypothetical protein
MSFSKDITNNVLYRDNDPKASYIVLDTTNKYSERVFPLDFNGQNASPYASDLKISPSEANHNSLLQHYFPRR